MYFTLTYCFKEVFFSHNPQSHIWPELSWTASNINEFGVRPVMWLLRFRLQVRLHIDLIVYMVVLSWTKGRDSDQLATILRPGCWKTEHSMGDLVVCKKMLNWIPCKDVHPSQSPTKSKNSKAIQVKQWEFVKTILGLMFLLNPECSFFYSHFNLKQTFYSEKQHS